MLSNFIAKLQNQILTPIITFLFVLATVVFLWGVIQYVIGNQGEPKKLEQGKQIMIWGIVGMFVMVSAWGIVKLLCDFFGTCGNVNF